jgi:hypothetical protein
LRILNRLGYDAKRIAPKKNGYYPVLYGSYATFAEAESKKRNQYKAQSRGLDTD